jgi:hypothetical protein
VTLAVVTTLVGVYSTVTVAYFVQPTLGRVAHPQAVVVLDGYGNRDSRAFAVAQADHVRTVAVSWPPYASCPAPRPHVRVLCFVPHPASTRGEAHAVARLARAHGWTRLLIVAGTTQVARARLYLERCYSGRLAFSGVDPEGLRSWMYQIAYGQGGLAKAIVSGGGC